MVRAGIDEAGRGPVLGPLVMAIVACDDEQRLRALGVKDSKLLSPEERERVAALLREAGIPFEIIELSPAEIDAAVKDDEDNLNKLEARTSALLIHSLSERVDITEVILDSPNKTTATYERQVRETLVKLDPALSRVVLRAEIKADFNHAVVGAASILAKVRRDERIRELEKLHGRMGSGYPSDPDTQRFLEQHWREQHDFFRRSWESYRRLTKPKQETLSGFGHKEVVEKFEGLREQGFAFEEPTNTYEAVRMRKGKVTIIRYTTGKLVVQGPDKERAEADALLKRLGLTAESKRPRGRPPKQR
jgi:ribonuclease HII